MRLLYSQERVKLSLLSVFIEFVLKPYTAGKISTENLLDNVLTYISEHFCFYTLCIISAYKYVKKLRKCK